MLDEMTADTSGRYKIPAPLSPSLQAVISLPSPSKSIKFSAVSAVLVDLHYSIHAGAIGNPCLALVHTRHISSLKRLLRAAELLRRFPPWLLQLRTLSSAQSATPSTMCRRLTPSSGSVNGSKIQCSRFVILPGFKLLCAKITGTYVTCRSFTTCGVFSRFLDGSAATVRNHHCVAVLELLIDNTPRFRMAVR